MCTNKRSKEHLRPRAGSPAARFGREVPIVVEVVVIAPLDMLVPFLAAAANAAATAGSTVVAIDGGRTDDGIHSGDGGTPPDAGQSALAAIPVAVFDHMHIGLMPAGSGPMMVVWRTV